MRTDVIKSLGHLSRAVGDPSIEARAETLVASEKDEKARKKQPAAWRSATAVR